MSNKGIGFVRLDNGVAKARLRFAAQLRLRARKSNLERKVRMARSVEDRVKGNRALSRVCAQLAQWA
jgi:hypothetical protein